MKPQLIHQQQQQQSASIRPDQNKLEKPLKQPINQVNQTSTKKSPFQIYSDNDELPKVHQNPQWKNQQNLQPSPSQQLSKHSSGPDLANMVNYDYIDLSPSNHYDSQKQIMGERTNNLTSPDKESVNQSKDISKIEQEDLLSQKMAVLYYTNPLNVIPETWEQESKTSLLHESQSIHFISKSKQSQSQLQQYNDQLHKQHDQQAKGSKQSSVISSHSKQRSHQSSHNQSSSYQKQSIADQSSESSRGESRKEKVEKIKNRLKALFLNYCDFSIENGSIFITYTNFLKIIKDSCIIDDQKVTQNHISIMLSKECNGTNNLIKNITFEQFLNCLLRISELKFPELYKKYPKSALQSLLKTYLLPLLAKIEQAVETQNDELQNSLFSVSEMTLKLIVFNEDTQVIFADIHPLMKQLYQMYFEQEIGAQKGKGEDLQKASLKSVMNFVRDFELSPYLVHQKACFLIWYSIAHSKDVEELSNNPNQKHIYSPSLSMGKGFTLSHFAIFIYRLSVIYFNHSQDSAQNFNLVKKLLYFFRKLENCDGFKKFMGKLNRTYNDSLTFLPSKDLLGQILKAEGVDDSLFANYDDYITKEAMLSRIVDPHLYVQNQKTYSQQDLDNEEMDMFQVNKEAEEYLMNIEEDLKRLFEIYCSYGEPMNTKFLKAGKLLKLLKDSGLIKEVSKLPESKPKRFHQISHYEADIIFKKVCFQGSQLAQNTFDPMSSQVLSETGTEYNHQSSGFMQYQSQLGTRVGSKLGGAVNSSSLNKTLSFDQHSYLTDKSGNQGRLDFLQFKKVLESISFKVVTEYPPTQAYVELLRHFILPLQFSANEKRCVHSKKIQHLLTQLDNQDMIELLTLFHKSIIDIYKIYADNKAFMNFTKFINFCSDYDIFPGMATKASLYRIFHSLSFINDMLKTPNKSLMTTSKISTKSQDKNQPQQSMELIDEHLFIEALALCALFNGSTDDEVTSPSKGHKNLQQHGDYEEETSEQSPIEKMLSFIERMANSDGIYKRIRKGNDPSCQMKCNLMDKKDLLDPFRHKYDWYFKNKYCLDSVSKKKNFQDIMEMSSVWTNSSQLGDQ